MYRDGLDVARDAEQAERWFKVLAENNHREAQIELASLSARAYKRIARKVRFRNENVSNPIDSAAWVEGRVIEQGDGWWKIAVTSRQSIVVANARIADSRVRPGIYVRPYGIVGSNSELEGLLYEVPEPAVKWTYALHAPQGVVRGRETEYIVSGTVTNTGLQPIKALELQVHAYQQHSPNSRTKTLTIHDLAPGEQRAFSATFSFFNIGYGGQTSVPQASVTGTITDW